MNEQKKSGLQKFLPYFVAILVFFIIIAAYFYPALEGKKIAASDTIHYRGMAKEITDYREKGENILWTNNMFVGMPVYQISINYSKNLMVYIQKMISLGFNVPIGMVIVYFLGFYFLLLVMRVNPWLSIAGAIAFAFSSYFFIIFEPGHTSKAFAIGFMAPVLAGVILTYRGKYIIGPILTTFFLALEITSNHPQITYYLLIMILVFGIVELIDHYKQKKFPMFLKATGLLMLAAFIAVLTNAANLWSTYEYSKYSLRGKTELTSDMENRTSGLDKDYATHWSYGIPETMTLLIPNFQGGSSQGELSKNSETYKVLTDNRVPNADKIIEALPVYWGDQPGTSGPVYVGALVFFLFIFSLFYLRGPVRWWGIAVTVLSIMLAWGKNFMPLTDFFLEYFPLYNKFRAVTMILVIAELSMPLLAFLALDQILKQKDDKKAMKKLQYSLYIVGGLLLFFILFAGALFNYSGSNDSRMGLPDWLIPALQDDRKSLLRTDAIRSLIFVLLTFGLLWAYTKGKLKLGHVWIILPLLVLIDMWPVNKRYLNNDDFVRKSQVDNPYQPTKADLAILKDTDPSYRVYNFGEAFDGSARTSYFHKNIGGYHGAKMRRYQELVDHCLIQEREMLADAFSNNTIPLEQALRQASVFNMLNTRYFIINSNAEPLRNPFALGNAWFVRGYKTVENADEEIAALNDFRPDSLAIIDKRFQGALAGFTPSTSGNSSIKLTSYDPDHLTYAYNASSDELAVFSEVYYADGWNAYIDGKKMPYFRANYFLRAMILPPGEHKLEFKFEPRSFYTGQNVSLAASLITIILTLGVILYFVFPDLSRKWTGRFIKS